MMKSLSRVIGRMVMSASLLLSTAMVWAQAPPAGDNTKANEKDQSSSLPTADQQKNTRSDRELTQQIRRSIVQDSSLSSYAHNVKIIARNGRVTLRGPVRSEDERQAIETKASEVAGRDNVVNDLTVVPSK
jgi:hyperosmotically inducible periplasmic protein